MAEPPPDSEAGLADGEGTGSGLRTFLIADVRGYTRFTQEHGDEAAAELTGTFAKLAREVVARCGGEVIELRGDEALVVFGSARQALRAAVELQAAFTGGADAGPPLPLGVGIGIDAGEAVPLEQGYRGAALNLAARLCSQAQPGEVLASESVTHLAGRVKGLEYREPGRLSLKGLNQPVRAYQVVSEGAARVKRPRRPAEAARRRQRSALAAACLLVVVAATVVVALSRSDSAHALARIDADSAGAIDPGNNRLVDQVRVGTGPGSVAAGFGSLWVVNDYDNTVSRIDPAGGSVQDTIPVDADPTAITTGHGFVWVVCAGTRSVLRIDPRVNRSVGRPVPVGNGPSGIAVSSAAVWVTNRLDDTVTEIDSRTGNVLHTRDAGPSPSDIAYGLGALWIANESASAVTRLDPATGRVEEIPVGNGPESVAIGPRSVWVANSLDGTVSRIDPERNVVVDTITVGLGPSSVLASEGAIWVADSYGGRVARIDPATRALTFVKVGSGPQSLAAIGGRIWLSARDTAGAHRGGTLRLSDFIPAGSLDDTVVPTAAFLMGDGLIGFKRVGGLDGGTLVPDLATSIPESTDGGHTYTFHVRRGIRYSNGDPVRASDFRRALERDFRVNAYAVLDSLVGADRCSQKRCDLSRGVVTDDTAGTVVLQLRQPDPVLFYKLALPSAYPVPRGVPMTKLVPLGVPGTGPYMAQSHTHLSRDLSRVVLVRNPRFRVWSAAAQPGGFPDKIIFDYDQAKDGRDKQVPRVEQGRSDFMVSPPAARLDEVETRYAAQVHVFPQSVTYSFFLNTRLPPFNNLAARQAVNYALDRRMAIPAFGGDEAAAVTCQILPAGMPGYRPYCPYTRNRSSNGVWTGPDLARARKLVTASGTRGQKVLVWTGPHPFERAVGPLLVSTLKLLGYRAQLKVVTELDAQGNDIYFSKVEDSRTRAQAGFNAWGADYPAAANFFTPLFTCRAFLPASAVNENTPELCDRHIDQAIERAVTGQTTGTAAAANARWSAVDRLVTDSAAWVPIVNPRKVVFVSRRAGNVQSNPEWGVLFDQMWVR
jgi:YVTN family beta-propeller protein